MGPNLPESLAGSTVRLGLTGGIACGKTTVGRMFSELGCEVLDADQVAREIVEPGMPALLEIERHFGPKILHSDGTLDRARLGNIIFADSSEREVLNQITHPRIREAIQQWMEAPERTSGIVVLEHPLLFESGQQGLVDSTAVVYLSPVTLQLERLMERNGLTKLQAEQRIQSQMPILEKVCLGDFAIENSGPLAETFQQVKGLLYSL